MKKDDTKRPKARTNNVLKEREQQRNQQQIKT